jgi:Peptidase family M28/PDZ domain/PA domain
MTVLQTFPRRDTQAVAFIALLTVFAFAALAGNEASEQRMRKDITFLASDACEGRGVTTKGINLAADYIAEQFHEAGLKPGGEDGTYFQPFTMSTGSRLGSSNTVVLHGPLGQEVRLFVGKDFQPLGLSASGKLDHVPVVFAGYGATAKSIGYDDFGGIDVAGKVIVLLRKTPRFENAKAPFDGTQGAYHAALSTKIDQAERHKAAAILFVNDRETARNEGLMEFSYTAFGAGARIPAVHVRRSVADTMLQSSRGRTLEEIEQDIDRDLTPRSGPLSGWTASLEVDVQRVITTTKNVVAVLNGKGSLGDETVVLGAHYDHLGYGGFGSLARTKAKAIHHGADDNGSGTTALIELARRFAQKPDQTRRRLVFIAFSGEESGLIGSQYYCKHPLFPLEDTVAMLNMDMVGRLRPDKDTKKDKLIVYGTGTAKTFNEVLDHANVKYDFRLQKIPTGMGPSDQESFYLKHIPVYFFFTGDHPDYHRPSDTADKINVPGMLRVTELVEDLTEYLETVPQRPQFVQVAGGASTMPRAHGPRLGIRPEYGDTEEGVLLGAVSEGGPAAKAGLKAADRIMEISGKPVKNLESYMALMAGYKKGDQLEIGILRNGKKQTVKVTLE